MTTGSYDIPVAASTGLTTLLEKRTNKAVVGGLAMGDKWGAILHTTNERTDVLQNEIGGGNGRITEIGGKLQELAAQDVTIENEDSQRIRRLAASLRLFIRVMTNLYQIHLGVQRYDTWMLQFNAGVTEMLTGTLQTAFVTPHDVGQLIKFIQDKVISKKKYIRLVSDNPAFYYLGKMIAFTRSSRSNSMYIQLSVPLTTLGGLLAAYRIDNLHITVAEGTAVATRIVNLPDYLLVSTDMSRPNLYRGCGDGRREGPSTTGKVNLSSMNEKR